MTSQSRKRTLQWTEAWWWTALRGERRIYGFDAFRCEYLDLVAAGVIDPTKVVRTALESAVSVASVLLLAEATPTKLSGEKKKAVVAHDSFE